MITKNAKLFNGTLGVYINRKVYIELLADAVSKYERDYLVPCIHLEAFKKELFFSCEPNMTQMMSDEATNQSLQSLMC